MQRLCPTLLLLAGMLLPLAGHADMSPPARGPAAETPPEQAATNAGITAGFAAACGGDPIPVRAAFAGYLDRRHSADDERQRLLEHLARAESATIARVGKDATGCTGVHEVVLRTVRQLEEASR